jgi:pimeloyl-ACP methyl ester carboxylesterase
VMFGTRDLLMDEGATAKDVVAMRNADAHEIPGAGHVICEETPDLVLKATRDFLRAL